MTAASSPNFTPVSYTHLLVDKLWAHIHEKFLSVSERRDVEKMAAELEVSLGTHKKAKSTIMQQMRAVTEKQARDQEINE